uniref:Uncharacterized protein n=1 Tax=Arundo donax TaxID=35708 RepID=A0A0A8XQI1_ARUDO
MVLFVLIFIEWQLFEFPANVIQFSTVHMHSSIMHIGISSDPHLLCLHVRGFHAWFHNSYMLLFLAWSMVS